MLYIDRRVLSLFGRVYNDVVKWVVREMRSKNMGCKIESAGIENWSKSARARVALRSGANIYMWPTSHKEWIHKIGFTILERGALRQNARNATRIHHDVLVEITSSRTEAISKVILMFSHHPPTVY